MPTILVSEAVATAIFTITRIFYNSIFNVIALILFSKLPGGSSAKFWYEQPDVVSKITSMFDPYGPTGKRGVKFTNYIAMLCMIAGLALNVLPTLLSKLSPITIIESDGPINATLSPISNVFIPTLTDMNVPRLSQPEYSREATIKFLCGYITNGCTDSKNNLIAEIKWDVKRIDHVAFERVSSDTSSPFHVQASIDDVFATESTPQQYIYIGKDLFLNDAPTVLSQQSPSNTSFSALYLTNSSTGQEDEYSMFNGDRLYPLNTPDLANLLRQGRRYGETVPINGIIDRAERWTAIHRTSNLSTVLWQSVNAHAGDIPPFSSSICFFCRLIGVNTTTAATMQRQLDDTTGVFVALQTTIDDNYRLTTTMCNIDRSQSRYWCMHSFTQLWNVHHEANPYSLIGSYDDYASGESNNSSNAQFTSTPFPFFPPPSNLTNERTYVPIVPIFEMRSKSQCDTEFDFSTISLQEWMNECAANQLAQPLSAGLDGIAENIWQLGSTMTVGGFLVTAQYFSNTMGIAIGTAVQVIILASVGLSFIGQLVLNWITSPIHRLSLYGVLRMMVPDSRDPYNVQKVLLGMAPTNTLRMVDSVFEKRVAYLKLNNRLIVTLSEDQTPEDDYMSKKELQNWSKRQLVKI